MDADQILAFRHAQAHLTTPATSLAQAASCPISDFHRDAALLALGARLPSLTRPVFTDAVDAGDLVVAHSLRGAIHAQVPDDLALHGRALIARDDDELTAQLGEQIKRLRAEHGFRTTDVLAEVAEAVARVTKGTPLDKNALHEALRQEVGNEALLPYCKGCDSHHVAPMLWRYATVKAGTRIDSERRYTPGRPGRTPKAADAVTRFLTFYGPNTVQAFSEWANLARPHAQRLWDDADLEETEDGHLAPETKRRLADPPQPTGVHLLPPGDPFLQKPNRPLLTPEKDLQKRLFRPVASPGAVLQDGRVAGLWRAKAKGRALEVTVEKVGRLAKKELEEPVARLTALRGYDEPRLTLS